ncbi:MAG: serine/threonine-protein phosphatase [Planctomycetes bacterium]|nr:serine/threonine-protein phosphatase [Planctomycetota bacterium]
MNVPSAFVLGSASHTGRVRVNNEDDYLLGALLPPVDELLLCAIADGMGGTAGGAEASRAALRALGSTVLDGASPEPPERRLELGFRSAAERVHEQAMAVPALQEMGTTLTALCLAPGRAVVGHIGDTRLYRVRAGEAEILTNDHALREPDNVLTRCIGGGQSECEPDFDTFETRAGDRFLLLTDGVWGVLPAAEIGRLAGASAPQTTAEALVAAALRGGGPDNATAVVVDVVAPSPSAGVTELALARGERPDARASWPRPASLRPPVWPWLALALALALAAVAGLRFWFGWDPWAFA